MLTRTINRLPAVMLDPGVRGRVGTPAAWAATCWTKVGLGPVGAGVTEFDCAEAGPVPFALLASRVRLSAVPSVSRLRAALVGGGEPFRVVAVGAVEPMYGVT